MGQTYLMAKRRHHGIKFQPNLNLRFVRTTADTSAWSHINSAFVFTDLQDAINDTPVNGKVCIAKGTYKPIQKNPIYDNESDYLTNDRYKGYIVSKKIKIQGGYNGDETMFSTSDIDSYPTILSGDIANSDYTTYAYKVLYLDQANVDLSNLIIEKAYADGALNNETLRAKKYGGGITYGYQNGGSSSLFKVTICNCIGTGYGYGAGFYVIGSNAVINFKSCKFHDNTSTNCIYSANLHIVSATVNILRCLGFDNSTKNYGGFASIAGGTLNIYNSLLYGNSSATRGGTIIVTNSVSFCNIYNCTIEQVFYRSILDAYNNTGYIKVYNSILKGNCDPAYPAILEYYNSRVQGSGGSGSWDTAYGTDGGGNIDTNPLFTNEAAFDFSLQAISPCIDTGDNSYNSEAEDLLGNQRIYDGNESGTAIIDMGCYEYYYSGVEILGQAVAKWDLDNNALDSIGSSDGSIVGAIAAIGRNGDTDDALLFNGSDDLVSVPFTSAIDLSGLSAFTIAAWVNFDAVDRAHGLFCCAGGSFRFTVSGGGYYMIFGTSDGNFSVSVAHGCSAGSWHLLAASYDGSNVKLYRDDALLASSAVTGIVNSMTQDVQIGNAEWRWMQGKMSDVMLWKRFLNLSEIQAIKKL